MKDKEVLQSFKEVYENYLKDIKYEDDMYNTGEWDKLLGKEWAKQHYMTRKTELQIGLNIIADLYDEIKPKSMKGSARMLLGSKG